jgi:ectoine hydroxylase-related dioxygenase (phytanoyl-CoA dioxygenase family)
MVRMLSQAEVDEFDRNGCLVGGRVVSDDEADELRRELDRVISRGPNGFAPGEPKPVQIANLSRDKDQAVWQIVNIWEASPAFERLLYHPRVAKAISQLTKSPTVQVWHDQIQFKPPKHGGINNWHQDAPYWPSITPGTPVTAWIPLDDVDESNGCMWMVPGSHKWGNHIKLLETNPLEKFFEMGDGFAPPADAETKQVRRVPWPVKKGDVSFHHSMTWHGSHKNNSDRPRRAIAIHYLPAGVRFVAKGMHPMKQFVQVADGEPMINAGEHFPIVVRNGEPVGVPARLNAAS